LLLPPSETGIASITHARSLTANLGRVTQRDDRVYVTADRELAKACAGIWSPDGQTIGGGVLYRVVPIGEVEPDDDLPGLGISFQVARAKVAAIHDPYVARNDPKYARKLQAVLGRLA
jgi:hypothetical protein